MKEGIGFGFDFDLIWIEIWSFPKFKGMCSLTENDVATKLLRLAMETDEERKARLEKIVSTNLLRLALETEEEGRAKNKECFLFIVDSNFFIFYFNEWACSPRNGNHFSSI